MVENRGRQLDTISAYILIFLRGSLVLKRQLFMLAELLQKDNSACMLIADVNFRFNI